MVAFSTIQDLKTDLIRKATGGSLFVNPSTATTLTALTGADSSLAALASGWEDGGLMTDEGMQWARSVELSEITSFGQSSATRSDVSTDDETCQVGFQQTSRRTISLFTSAAEASLVPDEDSGELMIAKPATPPQRKYQILGIAVDQVAAGDIYIAKYFPYASVTDYADQAWAKGDNAIQWGSTFKAALHPTAGFAVAWFFGGPGWASQLEQMGFDVTP